MNSSGGEGRSSIVDRVFCVIEACAGSSRPMTLVDLVDRTGLPKTTLHRVCWKLVQLGLLIHDDDGFRVGPKLFVLGSMSPELRRLRASAMPLLHQLVAESDWATNLAVMAEGRALVVEEVYAGRMGAMRRMVGARLPLHATAIGKALLAGLSQPEVDDLIGTAALRPYTATTIVRPNLLRDQLSCIRRSGVAFSHEEWSLGTSGVASPVRVDRRVVAAVAVVGPPGEGGMRQRAPAVRRAALRLERALGPAPRLTVAA